jgi:transposase-like protein
MAKKTRKRFTGQEKLAILRLHLLEHVAISDLCARYGIHPTMFCRWQKEFFENGAVAFEPGPDSPPTPKTSGSPPWSRSSNASTKSCRNSWRSISS